MPPQRSTVGAVHAIPLQDGGYCFALALPEADFAFFDCLAEKPELPCDLLALGVLFQISVHKSAWNTGRWPKVGKVTVPEQMLRPLPKFMQNQLNHLELSLYVAGEVRPATREECSGLERAAVWEPEHVESRLADHYAGRSNTWAESLRL